jgi:hypothetical protein
MGALGDRIWVKDIPGVAKRSWGGPLLSAGLCVLADVCADMIFRASQTGMISSPVSPDDVLGMVGKERGEMFKYPAESFAQFRARLLIARDTLDVDGSGTAIVGQLAAAGFPGATIELRPSLAGPRGEAAPYLSQFAVRFPAGRITGIGDYWGAPTWGDGTYWGPYGLSSEELQTIRAIIEKFRDGQAVCRWLIFEITGYPDYEVELPVA